MKRHIYLGLSILFLSALIWCILYPPWWFGYSVMVGGHRKTLSAGFHPLWSPPTRSPYGYGPFYIHYMAWGRIIIIASLPTLASYLLYRREKRKYLASAITKEGGVPCKHCGYDLRGNAGARECPECGQRILQMTAHSGSDTENTIHKNGQYQLTPLNSASSHIRVHLCSSVAISHIDPDISEVFFKKYLFAKRTNSHFVYVSVRVEVFFAIVRYM